MFNGCVQIAVLDPQLGQEMGDLGGILNLHEHLALRGTAAEPQVYASRPAPGRLQ
jgi:hypothetical protein